MVQGLGLQQAVIRQRDLPQEQLSRIFWLSVAVSLFCAALVAASAPGLAAFYREPALRWLTVAAAVPLLVASIASLPQAVLSRELRFGALAAIDGTGAVTGLLTALALAWLGARYWSLLGGTLAANLIGLLGCWRASGWRPGRPRTRLPDGHLLRFGANLSGFTLVNFFARNLDNVLIGRVAGAASLGFYDRAYTLMLFPLQTINGPISGVMVPLLSRIEADKQQLRAVYLRTVGQIVLISVPGLAAATAASSDVIALLFGPKWAESAPIFAWLGLAGLVQPLGNSTGWLFIAQGRTGAMFKWGIYAALTTIAAFIIGLHWGAVGVAAAYAISEYALRTPVSYWYLGRIGPVRAVDLVRVQAPSMLAAGLTIAAYHVLIAGAWGLQGVPAIAATVLLSYALSFTAAGLAPGGRQRLHESLDLLRHVLRLLPFAGPAGAPTPK
jgi:PST family polysaccharide transporter